MKILIDARLYGLENAGLGRYTMNLLNELAKLDRDNIYIILLRKKYLKDLKLPGNWRAVEADFRHYSLTEQFKLLKIINETKPDIVHIPHYNVPIFVNKPLVVTLHDILILKHYGISATTRSPVFYFVKYIAARLAMRKAVEKSKALLVPSQFVKDEVLKTYPVSGDKITVTHLGFDSEITLNKSIIRLKRKYGIDSNYFIYAGNAYPHKNLDRAIEAVVELNKVSSEKILFVIASARDVFTKRLKEKIAKMGAEQFVKLVGFLSDKAYGSLLKNSIAYLYPSIYEGFGLQGLEAMNVGTPVLASDIPVFKEIYGPAATYFNPYDFSSIVNAMRSMANISKEKRTELIAKGKKQASKYSWESLAKKTLEVYNSVK